MANRHDRRKSAKQAARAAVLMRPRTNAELIKLVQGLQAELEMRAELQRRFLAHHGLMPLLEDAELDPLIYAELPGAKPEQLPELRQIVRERLHPTPPQSKPA